MGVSKGLYVRIKRMDGCILYAHGRNLGQNVKIQRTQKLSYSSIQKVTKILSKTCFKKIVT